MRTPRLLAVGWLSLGVALLQRPPPTLLPRLRRPPQPSPKRCSGDVAALAANNDDTEEQVSPPSTASPRLSQPPALQRALLAVASTPFLSHEAPLPLLTRRLISDRARIIVAFVLEYIADAGLDVDTFASGGYVRDLLLGRISDDLDLCLCLTRCPPSLTIAEVVSGMPEFARRRPELAIERVEIVSALSESAVSKAIDASQVRLQIFGETPVVVDILPTIGAVRGVTIPATPSLRGGSGSSSGSSSRPSVDWHTNSPLSSAATSRPYYVPPPPSFPPPTSLPVPPPPPCQETYDSGDRIPTRDPRGSAQQDSLRRDLTVGSMLLCITRSEGGSDGRPVTREGSSARGGGGSATTVNPPALGTSTDGTRGTSRNLSAAARRWRTLRWQLRRRLRTRLPLPSPTSLVAPSGGAPKGAAQQDAAAGGGSGGSGGGGDGGSSDEAYVIAMAAADAASDLRFTLIDYYGSACAPTLRPRIAPPHHPSLSVSPYLRISVSSYLRIPFLHPLVSLPVLRSSSGIGDGLILCAPLSHPPTRTSLFLLPSHSSPPLPYASPPPHPAHALSWRRLSRDAFAAVLPTLPPASSAAPCPPTSRSPAHGQRR